MTLSIEIPKVLLSQFLTDFEHVCDTCVLLDALKRRIVWTEMPLSLSL